MKIGFVIAIEREIAPILEKFEYTTECCAGREIHVSHKGNDVFYFIRSGVGEIASASATQLLICAYGVEKIINVGVAGSLSDRLKLGDYVIATGIAHYDFDISLLDDVPVGKHDEFDSVVIPCRKNVVEDAEKAFPYMKKAIIASGDKFVANKSIKDALNRDFGAEVVEMESAGVLITAEASGIPCLIIKMISDNADQNAKIDFTAMFERNAKIVASFLEI